jgi:hypothetical protein
MRAPIPFIVLALVVATATTTRSASAQDRFLTVPLDSGALVRLHLDDGTVVRGRLLRPFAPDSTQLAYCRYPAPPCRHPDSPRVAHLDAALVSALEIQRGTRLWRGVAIGAGIGAALGWLAGSLYNGFCDYVGCGTPISLWMLSGTVQLGAWGALFGSQSVVWGPAP